MSGPGVAITARVDLQSRSAACRLPMQGQPENKQAHQFSRANMPTASEIYAQAAALFNRLPTPHLAPSSRRVYEPIFKRMWAEKAVEPLRAGDARDTIMSVGRPSMPAPGTCSSVCFDDFRSASDARDKVAAQRVLDILDEIVARCGPAIDRDPPARENQSTFTGQPSRWTEAEGPKPRRGKASKKQRAQGPSSGLDRSHLASSPGWRMEVSRCPCRSYGEPGSARGICRRAARRAVR